MTSTFLTLIRVLSISALTLLLSSQAQAGALEFSSIPEMNNQPANLVCSSFGKNGHTHIQLALQKNKVSGFLIFGVAPAKAASLVEVKKMRSSDVAFEGQSLKIQAVGKGHYFDSEIEISIKEVPGKTAWVGTFFFDDHDGISFEKKVSCGATNYQFMPR